MAISYGKTKLQMFALHLSYTRRLDSDLLCSKGYENLFPKNRNQNLALQNNKSHFINSYTKKFHLPQKDTTIFLNNPIVFFK